MERKIYNNHWKIVYQNWLSKHLEWKKIRRRKCKNKDSQNQLINLMELKIN